MAEAAMRFITLSDEAYGKLIRHDVAGGEHFVQFYDDDDYLAATVSRYFAAGLDAGEPVVALTTADHGRAFTERLAALGYEVDALRARGELILLDARETLSRLMVGTMPDWQCFEAIIGEVLARARRGRDLRVRAFGEMVDLLWSDGNGAAVVALEEMWNRIAPRAPFLLFCAYGIAHFGDQADAQRLNEICRQHGHVIPAEDYTSLTSDEDRQRQIALLQQRARSLETEIRYRKELERTLREALRARACAEEELRDFVENAMYALHWVAADGTILWANQAELDLVGYARDE